MADKGGFRLRLTSAARSFGGTSRREKIAGAKALQVNMLKNGGTRTDARMVDGTVRPPQQPFIYADHRQAVNCSSASGHGADESPFPFGMIKRRHILCVSVIAANGNKREIPGPESNAHFFSLSRRRRRPSNPDFVSSRRPLAMASAQIFMARS